MKKTVITEFSEELKAALQKTKITNTHRVIDGLLRHTGLMEMFKEGKSNIEGYLKKKGGLLPDNTREFMQWLTIAHPELNDVPCKDIQLTRDHFFEFSRHVESQIEPIGPASDPEPKNSSRWNHPQKHPFTIPAAYDVFKYLCDNYPNEKKSRWTYIFDFMYLDIEVDKHIIEDQYFEWVKNNYQNDMSRKRQAGTSEREKSKLKKLHATYPNL